MKIKVFFKFIVNDQTLLISTHPQCNDLAMIFGFTDKIANTPMHATHLSHILGEQIASPNRLIGNLETYATVAVGFPDLVTVLPNKTIVLFCISI